MIEGDVALGRLTQADQLANLRPVILLRQLPPFGDWLVCGVSSQLHQKVANFDEVIEPGHPDYALSGIKGASLIRLGFFTALPVSQLAGRIGSISHERHTRLLEKLSIHLRPRLRPSPP